MERCLASEKRASGKSRGWIWADQLALWGFEAVDCLGSCSAGWANCTRCRQLRHGFYELRWACAASRGARQPSQHDYPGCRHAGLAASGIASSGGWTSGLWRACHAAALAVPGGALGYRSGAMVSAMINRPPQQGHGSARTRASASVSPAVSSCA